MLGRHLVSIESFNLKILFEQHCVFDANYLAALL